MATLVGRADTKSFVENGECAVLSNFIVHQNQPNAPVHVFLQPPILSRTAVPCENCALVWMRLVQSNSSRTTDIQNWFHTDSLVALLTALIWACCGQALPVFSSKSVLVLPIFCTERRKPVDFGHQSPVLESSAKHEFQSHDSIHKLRKRTPQSFARAVLLSCHNHLCFLAFVVPRPLTGSLVLFLFFSAALMPSVSAL